MLWSKLVHLFCCKIKFKTVFIHDSGYLSLSDSEDFQQVSDCDDALVPKVHTICSWNIQELFWYCTPRKLENVLHHINCLDTDIICLQEVFELKAIQSIIHNKMIRDKYPYFLSGDMKNRYIIGENSGLFVLSKYPIRFIDFKVLPYATFPDCMSAKGVLYFTVGDLNYATTHLQSGCAKIARRQLKFIMENSPFKNNFIILGDFNFENAEKCLSIERNNNTNTYNGADVGAIDYILPISNTINIETSVLHFDLDNVSDHYPILGTISRKIRD